MTAGVKRGRVRWEGARVPRDDAGDEPWFVPRPRVAQSWSDFPTNATDFRFAE
jgi:hypothetical protein